MRVPRPLALATVVTLAAAVVPASAAAVTVTYDASATVRKVKQSGAKLVYRGTVRANHFGTGKVRQRVRVDGLRATGSFVVRYPNGKLRGRIQAQGTVRLDGKAAFSGTVRITGGTGRYAGASGSGSYTGSGPLNLSRATFRQRGTVRY